MRPSLYDVTALDLDPECEWSLGAPNVGLAGATSGGLGFANLGNRGFMQKLSANPTERNLRRDVD